MKKKWSNMWKSSVQTRKQRKYVKNAPLHIKHKFLASPLSAELRKRYGFRSIPVRSGDTVKIKSGQFKGIEGKVTKVSVSRTFAHVKGATIKRTDGTEVLYPIHPSNLEIVKLDLSDVRRSEKIEKLSASKKEVNN